MICGIYNIGSNNKQLGSRKKPQEAGKLICGIYNISNNNKRLGFVGRSQNQFGEKNSEKSTENQILFQ